MKTNIFEEVCIARGYTFHKDETPYVTNKTKVFLTHNECGHKWLIRPNDFQQGKSCPVCAKKIRKETLNRVSPKKTIAEILDFIKDSGYSLITTEYLSNKDKLIWKHNICGSEFNMRFNDFQQGYRCPVCSDINPSFKSKDEIRIEKILTHFNIPFEKEKRFNGLKYKQHLRFDFYIKDENIEFLIEYDGELHFKLAIKARPAKDFIETQKRDQIKTQFCIDNNLTLFRINYLQKTDDELLKILSNFYNIDESLYYSEILKI